MSAIPTKCLGGRNHGAFLAMDETEFDPAYINPQAAIDPTWHKGQLGYCSVCMTAMRWDSGLSGIIDWPEANVIRHCARDTCRRALAPGQHHPVLHLDIETFEGPHWPKHVREIPHNPAFEGIVCSPSCAIYEILDNEMMRDVFGRC